MRLTKQVRVRFGHADPARIVYYPRFFHFFHCAFEDFFDEQGFPYRECLDGDGVGWPAVHAEADFERPVRFGQVITVRLVIPKMGEKSVTFDYEVFLPDGERACTGRVVVACIGMDDYRGRPIPDKYRELFEKHLEPA